MAKGEFNYDKALQRIKDISEKLESDVSIEELEKMIKLSILYFLYPTIFCIQQRFANVPDNFLQKDENHHSQA